MPRKKQTERTEHVVWNVKFRSGYAWSHVGDGGWGSATFIAYGGGDYKSGHLEEGVALGITEGPTPPDRTGWRPWKVIQHWGEYVGAPTFLTHTLLLVHEMRGGKPYCTFITYDMPPTILSSGPTKR